MEPATVKSLEKVLAETNPPNMKIDFKSGMPSDPEWLAEVKEAFKSNNKRKLILCAMDRVVIYRKSTFLIIIPPIASHSQLPLQQLYPEPH